MVWIRPDGDAPPRYLVDLVGVEGHANGPAYASGYRLEEAETRARDW